MKLAHITPCCVVALIILIYPGFALSLSAEEWIEASKNNGIVSFFMPSADRIDRYDTSSNSWINSYELGGKHGTMSVALADSSGLYVAYDNEVYRYDEGSEELDLLSVVDEPVVSLHRDGPILIINHSEWEAGHLSNYNLETGVLVDHWDSTEMTLWTGGKLVEGRNIMIAINSLYFPLGLYQVSYDDGGSFLTEEFIEHEYMDGRAVENPYWLFPGQDRLLDTAGYIYDTETLKYQGKAAYNIDDVAFVGDELVLLRDNELTLCSETGLPLAYEELMSDAEAIFIEHGRVYAFASNEEGNLRLEIRELSDFHAANLSYEQEPRGLIYTPRDVLVDKRGIAYLLASDEGMVMCWDTHTQAYLSGICLMGGARDMAYHEGSDSLFLSYEEGLITRMDLSTEEPVEAAFARVGWGPGDVVATGDYIFSESNSDYHTKHYTFSLDGTRASIVYEREESAEYVWSDTNQRLYYLREIGSWYGFFSEAINADGVSYPSLAPGEIGEQVDSPLHDTQDFGHPLRLSPDSTYVVFGSGVIHDALSMERLPNALPNEITDAAWIGDTLFSVSDIDGGSSFQSWNSGFSEDASLEVEGSAQALLEVGDHLLLGVTMLDTGEPSFYLLDENLELILPDVMERPLLVDFAIVSDSEVEIRWGDVSGESLYELQRSSDGINWGFLASTGAGECVYTDPGLSANVSYYYRVRARNGDLVSAFSEAMEVAFTVPPIPELSGEAIGDYQVYLTWKQIRGALGYGIEYRIAGEESWESVAYLPSIQSFRLHTSFDLIGRTVEYRIQSRGYLGYSEYSEPITVQMPQYVPEAPQVLSYNTNDPESIEIRWKDGHYEDGYQVEINGPGYGGWTVLATLDVDLTSYLIEGLIPETNYSIRVKSFNELGEAYSRTKEFYSGDIPVPSRPWDISAEVISSDEIHLAWSEVEWGKGFKVLRSTGFGDWVELAELSVDQTSYVDHPPSGGIQYEYRVVPFNNAGDGECALIRVYALDLEDFLVETFDPAMNPDNWTAFESGTVTQGNPGFADSNVALFRGGEERVIATQSFEFIGDLWISFKFKAEDVEPYQENVYRGIVLELSDDDGLSWHTIREISLFDPENQEWKEYLFRMPYGEVIDRYRLRWRQYIFPGAGQDTWAIDDVRVLGLRPVNPSAPSGLSAELMDGNQVRVTWGAGAGALAYEIERSLEPGEFESVGMVGSSSLEWIDQDVAPFSQYTYRVRSRYLSNASSYTNTDVVMTEGAREIWLKRFFGSSGQSGNAAPQALNGNGLPNLIEYAFNLDPFEGDQPRVGSEVDFGLPLAYRDAMTGSLCVDFVRIKESAQPGIRYLVEFSSDMTTWEPAGGLASRSDVGAYWERVCWSDSELFSGDRFVRVRVEELR